MLYILSWVLTWAVTVLYSGIVGQCEISVDVVVVYHLCVVNGCVCIELGSEV